MRHDEINNEAISILRERLEESVAKFETYQTAGKSQAELNAVYRDIKVLTDKIATSELDKRGPETR